MRERHEHQEATVAGVEEARQWAESHRKHAAMMYGKFPEYVRSLGGIRRCLEIGSGPATLAAMVAECNPQLHITALDISPDMVAVAREYIEEKKLQDNIHLVIGDAADEGVMGGLGQFDLVYSFFSLHDWEDPQKVISNLLEATTDEGRLYLHDFRRVWWARYLPLTSGEKHAIAGAYTPGEARALLGQLGVRQCEIRRAFPCFQSLVVTRNATIAQPPIVS
jgi:SAM-dependent methyltransferase